MAGPLWSEARDALAGVAEIASKYDTDGIDIYFLNSPLVGNGLRHAADVQRLFDQVQPDGITPTGEKLEELLLVYLWRLEQARERAGDMLPLREIKPVNYLIITDGAPSRLRCAVQRRNADYCSRRPGDRDCRCSATAGCWKVSDDASRYSVYSDWE